MEKENKNQSEVGRDKMWGKGQKTGWIATGATPSLLGTPVSLHLCTPNWFLPRGLEAQCFG